MTSHSPFLNNSANSIKLFIIWSSRSRILKPSDGNREYRTRNCPRIGLIFNDLHSQDTFTFRILDICIRVFNVECDIVKINNIYRNISATKKEHYSRFLSEQLKANVKKTHNFD